MSTREIEAHLLEMYGAEVSPTLISSIVDAVNDEIKLWQSRPLDPCYAIVYLECLMLKVRDDGSVSARAVYLAVGVNLDGMKEVLGIWTAQTEGAKFWLAVITELMARGQPRHRGVADIRRWPERLSRSNRSGISAYRGAAMPGSYGSP